MIIPDAALLYLIVGLAAAILVAAFFVSKLVEVYAPFMFARRAEDQGRRPRPYTGVDRRARS